MEQGFFWFGFFFSFPPKITPGTYENDLKSQACGTTAMLEIRLEERDEDEEKVLHTGDMDQAVWVGVKLTRSRQ